MLGLHWASLVAQLVKNPPVIQETRVRPLGWKDALEEGRLPTVLTALCGRCLAAANGDCALLWHVGSSGHWLLLLRRAGSRCAGFSAAAGSTVWAQQLLPGMWSLPRSRMKPVSLALAGGFLPTASPRKSLANYTSIGI